MCCFVKLIFNYIRRKKQRGEKHEEKQSSGIQTNVSSILILIDFSEIII